MQFDESRNDLPVLLLHDLDPDWPSEELDFAQRVVTELEEALSELGHPMTNVEIADTDLAGHLSKYDPRKFIVFNWCEALPGIHRSDVLVAQTLASMNFTYTGSTPSVLALSWDKRKVKRLLDRLGLPTPKWRVYESPRADDWDRFPAIVKPAMEHSSYGVAPEAVVLTPEELNDRIAYVVNELHEPALVEEFIDGREFHVSIWGDGVAEMLPAVEVDFAAFDDVRDRLYTFDSKFTPGTTAHDRLQFRAPAPLDDNQCQDLEKTSLAVFRAFACRDYARLDARLRDGVFYVLDVNPNPAINYMKDAAEAAGYSYGAMGSYLVNLAAQRHPRHDALKL